MTCRSWLAGESASTGSTFLQAKKSPQCERAKDQRSYMRSRFPVGAAAWGSAAPVGGIAEGRDQERHMIVLAGIRHPESDRDFVKEKNAFPRLI